MKGNHKLMCALQCHCSFHCSYVMVRNMMFIAKWMNLKMISIHYQYLSEERKIFTGPSIMSMVSSDSRKWLRSAFLPLSQPPSAVWATRVLSPAVVAISCTQSVCSELQTGPDSLRGRNVPLCGVVWPEMPPQDTHLSRNRAHREDKERDTALCQHQEGSREGCCVCVLESQLGD